MYLIKTSSLYIIISSRSYISTIVEEWSFTYITFIPAVTYSIGSKHMKINLTSVFVDDQDKALKFYTDILGFVKKTEIPLGHAKWLTVVSPEEPDCIELLLEPDANPAINNATQKFKKAVYNAGIPFTSFAVDNIQREYERLTKLGVKFTLKPTKTGPVTMAVFDDTCGNLIQIAQNG